MTVLRPAACVAAVLALLFVAVAALTTPDQRFSNDSYRYGAATLELLGTPPAEAHSEAVSAFCTAVATRSVRDDLLRPDRRDEVTARPKAVRQADCAAKYRAVLPPDGPRMDAIFAPRVGYPLIAVPVVAVLGLGGMWLASALCAAAAGLLLFALLRSWGSPPAAAGAGQALLYVSPAGQWGTWALAEGASLLALTAAVVGAAWVVDRRRRGLATLVCGLVAGVVVKYSTGLLVAATLALAAVVLAAIGRHRAGIVAGVSAVCAGLTLAAQRMFGWPGAATTLQDAFTGHFVRPDVADPWAAWAEQSTHFWVQWVPDNLPLVAAATVAVLMCGWSRSPLVAAPLFIGLAVQAAHPLASQADRLYAPAWLAAAIGVPLAALALGQGRHASSSRSTRATSPSTRAASWLTPAWTSPSRDSTE